MSKTLLEYADWLDERNLLWPAAPQPVPAKATPYLPPLPEVRAVTWSVYGTLLLIADGRLLPSIAEPIRMEVALEKTIHEFNMWNSMYRKPGAPWEYMLQQFRSLVEIQRLTGAARKGEAAEVNLPRVWRTLIERLQHKDYAWDEDELGDIDEFSEKVAYFFQSCLQGLQAAPNARAALAHIRRSGCRQGLVADGQVFTLTQILRALRRGVKTPSLTKLFSPGCVSLSYQFGVRQPAESLFEACLASLQREGISAAQTLHVASRLRDELGPAKRLGMRTALYAGDRHSLEATPAEVADSALRPDRILTDLRQIRQIVRSG
ncbi:MAG: HAD family hydrolase [Planctomycetaceae bacterium]|nr:HAD family hydrolase [Planctomycetaceae bacterium]